MKPIIAISKLQENYDTWLLRINPNIEILNCYEFQKDLHALPEKLKNVSGILITGGNDINPDLYGCWYELPRCGKLDTSRDALELWLIRYALANGIPLLGICRGHQILNVALGGTLIVDIPTDMPTSNIRHGKKNGHDAEHSLQIVQDTLLYKILQSDSLTINSSHHQAVGKIAPSLKASAYAPDGIVEAIEPIEPQSFKNFILGIQWHPERMKDTQNPATYHIGNVFLQKAYEFFKQNQLF
ncbi:MAG: gamma-glutamyl-gamma-aminobutyrate hydrolase family protein [Cytophagales bacterium]|nr:gamma-glutamyl-gamma-aminobutyrate hydrolase family protein [Cytophagales bacterium]MDW8384893.1 gamma-glutamyl-gamma-aminobutyrate hydrolase family protein [Flammeovirgaceae bacterium]